MKRNLFLFSLCCLSGVIGLTAPAQTPVQVQATIGVNDTVVDWTVPSGAYGPLLSLQITGLANAATLKVEHLVAFTGGIFTNAIEATAAADTLLVYPAAYVAPQTYVTNDLVLVTSPVKPIYLARGDKLRFTPSATNGAAKVVMRVGVGK